MLRIFGPKIKHGNADSLNGPAGKLYSNVVRGPHTVTCTPELSLDNCIAELRRIRDAWEQAYGKITPHGVAEAIMLLKCITDIDVLMDKYEGTNLYSDR